MSYDVNPSVEGKTLLLLVEDSKICGADNPLFCSTEIHNSPFKKIVNRIWNLQNDKILDAFYYYEVVMNSSKCDFNKPSISGDRKNWENSTWFQLRSRAKIITFILSYFTRAWRENGRSESDVCILPADGFIIVSSIY